MARARKIPASIKADRMIKALTRDRKLGLLDKASSHHAFEMAAEMQKHPQRPATGPILIAEETVAVAAYDSDFEPEAETPQPA